MNFIKRTVNYFKVRKEKDVAKELDKKFVILFGLTSWVEVYDKGNKEYLNKEDVKVYSFSDCAYFFYYYKVLDGILFDLEHHLRNIRVNVYFLLCTLKNYP